jgi:SAM-dependent methyltransferase
MMSESASRPALPPQLVLYQMAIGHYFSRALHLAAKLGVADLLKDGARRAEDLAQATDTHAPSLRRVLRLLASVGVFDELEDGRFALTPVGECLRADVPGSSRAMAQLFAGPRAQDSWKELEQCVRTGEPVWRLQGAPDWVAGIAKDPAAAANFDAAMADFTKLAAIAVAATYDFSPFRTVIDVGGGNGALLLGILRANPDLEGIVADRREVAERAEKEIAASGLAKRCRAVAADFFREVPSGADAYLLKHVIHDWDDDRARTILVNCRRAIPPHGKLLLIEGVYPPRIDDSLESRGAAANDVNMLVATGGRQRSEGEFRSLYSAAGFRLTRIVPTPARVSVIEGVPA